MELHHIIYLLIAFLIIRFWWLTFKARELAEQLVKRICTAEDIQLLDGTVALSKFGIKKSKPFQLKLIRYFKFEFSTNSVDRRQGLIALHQNHQEYIFMDLPEKPTIDVQTNTLH